MSTRFQAQMQPRGLMHQLIGDCQHCLSVLSFAMLLFLLLIQLLFFRESRWKKQELGPWARTSRLTHRQTDRVRANREQEERKTRTRAKEKKKNKEESGDFYARIAFSFLSLFFLLSSFLD